MVRVLASLMLGLLFGMPALAQDTRPPARFWLEIEPAKGDRYVQEMIIARLHAIFARPIALLKMPPFELEDFQTIRLGEGRWYTYTGDGFESVAYELTLALFPKRSGDLVIPPFTQDLTYIDRQSKRVAVTQKTEPATIRIKPALVDKNSCWLPASEVTVQESWSADPSNLEQGEPVRRTITLKAIGQLTNQLPPPPNLRTEGLIVSAATPVSKMVVGLPTTEFARQPKKSNGVAGAVEYAESDRAAPISTITYSWLIRPTSGAAVIMPPVELPWFDTDTGTAEKIVLSAKTIAFKDPGPSLDDLERSLGINAESAPFRSRWAAVDALVQILAFLAALWATLVILSPQFRHAIRQVVHALRDRLETHRVRRAAKKGDAASVWRIYHRIIGPDSMHRIEQSSTHASPFARLQAAVFGAEALTKRQLQEVAVQLIQTPFQSRH
jgi:hypothetical protein